MDSETSQRLFPLELAREVVRRLKGRASDAGVMVLPAVFKVPRTEGPRDTSGLNEYDAMATRRGHLLGDVAKRRTSKSRIALEELVAGGASRQSIYPRIRERLEAEWGDRAKVDQVPQVVYQLLKRLKAKGWTVESFWRVVPPGGHTIGELLGDVSDLGFFGVDTSNGVSGPSGSGS